MHESVNEKLVTSHVLQDLTLEAYAERALVHLRRDNTTMDQAMEIITSDANVSYLADKLINEFRKKTEGRTEDPPSDIADGDIDSFVQDILNEFDGFDKENALYSRLIDLFNSFPYKETVKAVEQKKEAIAEKLKDILTNVLNRKKLSMITPGLESFVYEFGNRQEIEEYKNGKKLLAMIEKILIRRSHDVVSVKAGSSHLFDVYRIAFRNADSDSVRRTPSNVVIKILKGFSASSGGHVLDAVRDDHLAVSSAFTTPPTLFSFSSNYLTSSLGAGPNSVFQQFIEGQSIAEAAKDPHLESGLRSALKVFITLMEKMIKTRNRTLDCFYLNDRGILVRRSLEPMEGDILRIWVPGTGRLVDLRGKGAEDDRKRSKNFLDSLRDAQRGKLKEAIR